MFNNLIGCMLLLINNKSMSEITNCIDHELPSADDIQERKSNDTKKSIYFISGHLDISEKDFETHYKQKIDDAIKEDSCFVIGDAAGVDHMAQKYLASYHKVHPELCIDQRVIVYHMLDAPRHNVGNFATKGGFKNDLSRDTAMTESSDDDILWIRSPEESKMLFGDKYDPKRKSGTEKNHLRRIKQREKLNGQKQLAKQVV